MLRELAGGDREPGEADDEEDRADTGAARRATHLVIVAIGERDAPWSHRGSTTATDLSPPIRPASRCPAVSVPNAHRDEADTAAPRGFTPWRESLRGGQWIPWGGPEASLDPGP
jgi:hypothetical protein